MRWSGWPERGRSPTPREAEAFHFCGHIYTTDSCPHPTGLPRIDAKGFPLKAANGRPVDDLGRYIDATGKPVADDGAPLVDADGAPAAQGDADAAVHGDG